MRRGLIGSVVIVAALVGCSASSSSSSAPATSGASARFGTNYDNTGKTGGVCYLARVSAHNSNSEGVSVADSQAAAQAVVDAASGSQNVLSEHDATVLNLMDKIQTDQPANLVDDIAKLADACDAAGE